jgi:hypothetical protein
MNVLKATAKDFIEVWYLLEVNARKRKAHGYFADLNMPETRSLLEDGFVWLYRNELGVCLGTLVFSGGGTSQGELVNPLLVRDIALYPYFNCDEARLELLKFARTYASELGFSHLVYPNPNREGQITEPVIDNRNVATEKVLS